MYAVADGSAADTTQTVIQYVNGRWSCQLNVIVLTMCSIQRIETDLVSGACSVPTGTSLSHLTNPPRALLLKKIYIKKKLADGVTRMMFHGKEPFLFQIQSIGLHSMLRGTELFWDKT